MSLHIELGERGNLLDAKPEYARLLMLETPVLNEAELEEVKTSGFDTAELSTLFEIATGPQGLEAAVRNLCAQAVGAVHHHLIRKGLRMKASLIVDTAQCWDTHHFGCLIGYGASAVCPYLALESVRQWV